MHANLVPWCMPQCCHSLPDTHGGLTLIMQAHDTGTSARERHPRQRAERGAPGH